MQLNRIVIDGRVLKLGPLRHTPAGTPAIDLMISHRSTQGEAGRLRQVQCELDAVALGPAAVGVSKLRRDQQLRLSGFLARRSASNRGLVLHVTATEPIEDVDRKLIKD